MPAVQLPGAYSYKCPLISDKTVWAQEVVRQLNSEREDGSTPVHRMFDAAFLEALEQGAEGISCFGDTDYAAFAAASKGEGHD
jgi:hypothetical protein